MVVFIKPCARIVPAGELNVNHQKKSSPRSTFQNLGFCGAVLILICRRLERRKSESCGTVLKLNKEEACLVGGHSFKGDGIGGNWHMTYHERGHDLKAIIFEASPAHGLSNHPCALHRLSQEEVVLRRQ